MGDLQKRTVTSIVSRCRGGWAASTEVGFDSACGFACSLKETNVGVTFKGAYNITAAGD